MYRPGNPVWPENPIRRILRPTKGYISVRNFGICEPASALETPRIKQETPEPGTRRIAPVCQPFMTDASVAAVMTARLDRAGEVGHCWFIQPAREISRKRNGSRHFDIGSSNYRRRQGLSPAVSDRSSFRAIRRLGFHRHSDSVRTWSSTKRARARQRHRNAATILLPPPPRLPSLRKPRKLIALLRLKRVEAVPPHL